NGYVGSVSGSLMNNANGTGSTYVVGNIAGSVHTNSGSTVYGGSLTGSATANGSGSVKHEPVTRPFDPATVASDAINSLTAYSSQLNGIAKNSDYSSDGGTVTFTASGTGLTSFEITDADSFFSNAGQFQFNLNDQQTILINVRGADAALNLHANFLAGAAPNWGKRILWNFVDAKSINVNAQFGGSILALFADVTVDQNLEGTLVANRLLRQSAEIHSQPLDSSYPAAVPLPAAAPLFAAALAGLGAFARRGRKLSA
ncbi:MAG: choice-of-anchor family protein, partial [Proteobacteria bacterium]|nr:choice-of-anchor family protein [Pseudomonadota bacterium]